MKVIRSSRVIGEIESVGIRNKSKIWLINYKDNDHLSSIPHYKIEVINYIPQPPSYKFYPKTIIIVIQKELIKGQKAEDIANKALDELELKLASMLRQKTVHITLMGRLINNLATGKFVDGEIKKIPFVQASRAVCIYSIEKDVLKQCTCSWLSKHRRVRSEDCPIHNVKIALHMRIDADVLDWFKKQGKGYSTRMNSVLRQHMEMY